VAIIVEGKNSFQVGGSAYIVEEGREMAWAENHIKRAPDVRWILGNYVQAATEDHPTYNSNGHSFPYEDLKDSVPELIHRPLNLNHAPNRRLGVFTAAEFVWPTIEGAAADVPLVEALAAYWHYYEPELFASVELAHKEGSLFFSMEAVPNSITCRGNGVFEGCGQTFEYAGRQSPSYCSHLNEKASRKVLHKPRFTAGALILPPVRPGWRNADITQISSLIESNLEEAEKAYEQVSKEAPHLDPVSWERIAAFFLSADA
jgi:hypothetical protein